MSVLCLSPVPVCACVVFRLGMSVWFCVFACVFVAAFVCHFVSTCVSLFFVMYRLCLLMSASHGSVPSLSGHCFGTSDASHARLPHPCWSVPAPLPLCPFAATLSHPSFSFFLLFQAPSRPLPQPGACRRVSQTAWTVWTALSMAPTPPSSPKRRSKTSAPCLSLTPDCGAPTRAVSLCLCVSVVLCLCACVLSFFVSPHSLCVCLFLFLFLCFVSMCFFSLPLRLVFFSWVWAVRITWSLPAKPKCAFVRVTTLWTTTTVSFFGFVFVRVSALFCCVCLLCLVCVHVLCSDPDECFDSTTNAYRSSHGTHCAGTVRSSHSRRFCLFLYLLLCVFLSLSLCAFVCVPFSLSAHLRASLVSGCW